MKELAVQWISSVFQYVIIVRTANYTGTCMNTNVEELMPRPPNLQCFLILH